jgi:hypothetical protein
MNSVLRHIALEVLRLLNQIVKNPQKRSLELPVVCVVHMYSFSSMIYMHVASCRI